MKQNAIYQRLLRYAIDNNYTVEQVLSATKRQIANVLGVDSESFTNEFGRNMKTCLVDDLQRAKDAVELLAIKTEFTSWLLIHYPDYKVDRGNQGGKPYVRIWLKGKPVEDLQYGG